MGSETNIPTPLIRTFVERLEALAVEKRDVDASIAEVYAEAKSAGFDKAALKLLVDRRSRDKRQAGELSALADAYEVQMVRP